MTDIDKQAAIAALKADLDELRVAVTSHGTGYDRKPVAIASALGNARRLIAALEADDGRALLRQLREHVAEWQRLHEQAVGDPTVDQRVLQGYLAIERDVMDKIDRLLAAEPAQSAEPAAPASDDEARIAECMHRVGQAMLSMRHDWMLCVYDRDNPEDQKRKEAVESIGEAFALMRSLLARAVKAEADLATERERHGVVIDDYQKQLRIVAKERDEIADLRAKLAAAEKERDAAIAGVESIVEDLSTVRRGEVLESNGDDYRSGWRHHRAGALQHAEGVLAALRSSPPAAPAGEALAQGAGDDDTLRRFLRFGEDIPRGGERLLSVVADLCRRELARGER